MISKARSKYIKSLQVKKYRKQEQSFLVEGAKGVVELLSSQYEVSFVCATPEFLSEHEAILRKKNAEIVEVSEDELTSIGSVESNEAAIAVAKMGLEEPPRLKPTEWILALDDVRDPGNLGTIIRTADWYGIGQVIASPETADVYNPKVIRATMGSFTRVRVHYTPLVDLIRIFPGDVYGAFLDGDNAHQVQFGKGGMLVIGSESHGISEEVTQAIKRRITIPRVGRAESLNAGVATAILLDNIFRGKV